MQAASFHWFDNIVHIRNQKPVAVNQRPESKARKKIQLLLATADTFFGQRQIAS